MVNKGIDSAFVVLTSLLFSFRNSLVTMMVIICALPAKQFTITCRALPTNFKNCSSEFHNVRASGIKCWLSVLLFVLQIMIQSRRSRTHRIWRFLLFWMVPLLCLCVCVCSRVRVFEPDSSLAGGRKIDVPHGRPDSTCPVLAQVRTQHPTPPRRSAARQPPAKPRFVLTC